MSILLKAERREKLGSRHARYLRAAGRIPCSIQGEDKDNAHFSIEEHAFLTARRAHQHLFEIEVAGGAKETGIVRELHWDALGDRIAHVEFRRVELGKETESEVEIVFRGHPRGGVLNQLISHLTILSLPGDIPDALVVSVDGLEEGGSLHAKDIPMPKGVRLADTDNPVVATVSAASGIDAPAPAEGEAGAEPATPAAGDAGKPSKSGPS